MNRVIAVIAVVAVAPFIVDVSARAQSSGGERLLIYVDDIATTADPKMRMEASALTSTLCGALAKEKRLDVLCAPDVKQILSFAAASSMIGSVSPAVENVTRRLDAVKLVVSGSLAPRPSASGGAGDIVLTVQAGPKAADADASALYADAAIVKIEEVGPAKDAKLGSRLGDVTQRLVRAMLSSASSPSNAPPPPPPAPLK